MGLLACLDHRVVKLHGRDWPSGDVERLCHSQARFAKRVLIDLVRFAFLFEGEEGERAGCCWGLCHVV